jgi:hypothetical protein
MENNEEEGKIGPDTKVALPEHLQRILERINAVPRARAALEVLKRNGCDETAILHNLSLYCGGSEDEVRAALEAAFELRDELDLLATRLVEDAQSSRRVLEKINAYQLVLIDVAAFSKFTSVLEDRADLFKKLGRILRSALQNVRIGEKGKGRGKVNLTAGRIKHLVYLVYLVSGRYTPRSEHFELIAPLVKAVLGDERSEINIKDGLRSAVKGYRERFPEQALMLREEARAEHYEWKNKSKVKSLHKSSDLSAAKKAK